MSSAHLAFVREYINDGGTETTNAHFYFDGVLADSATYAGGFMTAPDGPYSDLYIGNRVPYISSLPGITGTFDEIRFTREALSDFGVPEPATIGLLAIGGLLLRRKNRK